jgi:glyoxylase-like metal-dependent hydrolase (beta-lactamase superfamily II)
VSTPAPRVVHAANPSPMTLDGTRVYLVGRARVAVIDPGPADARHLDRLTAELRGAEVVGIVLTHAHADHAAGAAALARRTAAPLMMARGALAPPVPDTGVGHWLAEGDALETDAGVLQVIETPGHAPEHIALWWRGAGGPEGGALFVGDLMMGEGDTALVAHPEGDLERYLRSLDRLEHTGAAVYYPTHGPPLADPRDALRRYREHRRQRLQQVVRALQPGTARPDVLLDRVYGESVPVPLRPAAAASLRAMLDYLERTGVVRADGAGYTLIPNSRFDIP